MAGGGKKDVGGGLGRKEQCCRRAVTEGWIEEREGSMHGVEGGGEQATGRAGLLGFTSLLP